MPKNTCTFYVDYKQPPDEITVEPEGGVGTRMLLEPDLLSGEIVTAKAGNVLKFFPYASQKRGSSGVLYCTNYRLSFVTSEKDESRCKLLGLNDVSLANMAAIYQVFSDKTRRKLTKVESGAFADTAGLVIHGKDFSIHSFDFKFTKKEEVKMIVNTVIQMASPRGHRLLFAHAYASANEAEPLDGCDVALGSVDGCLTTPTLFNEPDDWTNELARQHATTDWRVTCVNEQHHICESLPRYFVVPSSVSDKDIRLWAGHYLGNRLPVWCYSTVQGNFLMRSSILRSDRQLTITERQKKVRYSVELCKILREKKRKPLEVDLSRVLPNVDELQTAHEKLAAVCAPETATDFIKSDGTFYSELESSRWLEYVAKFLKECDRIANLITVQDQSVILQDACGRDLSCVVSSLVQLMIDDGSRSMSGFQELVQREWVAMGHEFSKRIGLVREKDQQASPVFLLFLECVWRLTLLYPASFGFTEIYLVSLWDSALLGLFREFVFNSDKQRWSTKFELSDEMDQAATNSSCSRPPSVWHWQLQFRSEDMLDFINPLYQIQKLRSSDAGESKRLLFDEQLPLRRVWYTCHFRWLSPVQILNGGEPAAFFQQCVLAREADAAASCLSSDSYDGSSAKLHSQLPEHPPFAVVTKSLVLTSTYPFVKSVLRCDDEATTAAMRLSGTKSASLLSLLEKSTAQQLDWMRDDNLDD